MNPRPWKRIGLLLAPFAPFALFLILATPRYPVDRRNSNEHETPGFDEPQEFARILNEMKTAPGRSQPDYAPGYRHRELVRSRRLKEQIQLRTGVMPGASALPWVSRGPGNVAGRALGIVVDPDDPANQTWFIGTAGGGVWKTADGGSTWQWLTPDFPVLSAQSIAMAPSDHDVLYVGTGESFYNVDTINGDGILKSTDRGATWTQLASTAGNPAFNNVARLLVDPTDAGVVLAAATTGVYKLGLNNRSSIFKSIDGGTNWTEVYASIPPMGQSVKRVQQLVADPTDFNVLYATVNGGGILKSTDRGDHWSFSNTGISDFTGRFELAVSPVDHNRLFAAAEGASNTSKLWLSTNAGATWSQVTGSVPNWLNGQGWYDNTLVCHPSNSNVVYVGGVYLYRVTLSGTVGTWSYIGSGIHVDHHGLAIISDGGSDWRLLDTSDGGVAVAALEDAGLSQVTDGMVTTQFYGVDKAPGASLYLGGTQDNGTWQSPEDPAAATGWTPVIGGDGFETCWSFDDPLKLIGGYQFNGITRSLDGGVTWNGAAPGDNGSGNAPFITKIAQSQLSPDLLFAVGKSGVWRSTDFAGHWTLSAVSAGNWGGISSFHDVRISRANSNIVWAGAYMGSGGHIMRSTDGGLTFNPVNDYTTVTMGRISGLATDPADSNTAYVLFSYAAAPKILRTVDGGMTWNDITGFETGTPSTNGFPDVAVYDLEVFSDDPNHLWAATEIGLVESTDGGATWALAGNGLPNVGIWRLIEVEDQIVAATHGRGIWSVTIPDLVAGKTFNPLIEDLYQTPDGMLNVDMNLRSAYDSTRVYVDSAPVSTLGANAALDRESVQVPALMAGTRQVHLESYAGGQAHASVTKSIDIYPTAAPVNYYANDFESPTADFAGSLFRIGTEPGFPGSAIHSLHPYNDQETEVYTLTVPIRVALGTAQLEYDDVALVEPGDPGSVFGDANFWDYVIVEGTKDGHTWLPLAPGYDCRAYPEWLAQFNSGNPPDSTLFRHEVVDLHDTFAAGDTILVRFRLFGDEAVHGWGWVVDNLVIQSTYQTGVADGGPGARLALAQNAPNPFRSSTSIGFSLPKAARVKIEVFDVSGRAVAVLADGEYPQGESRIAWNGLNDRGRRLGSGEYFYRLRTAGETLTRKLVLLR